MSDSNIVSGSLEEKTVSTSLEKTVSVSPNISSPSEEKKIDLNNRVVEEKWKKGGAIMNMHRLVNGVKHGEELWYYSNGILMVTFNWNNGVKDGSWKRFNFDGLLANEEIWNAGTLESSTKGAAY